MVFWVPKTENGSQSRKIWPHCFGVVTSSVRGQWKRHFLVKTMTSSHRHYVTTKTRRPTRQRQDKQQQWRWAELLLYCSVTPSTCHCFLFAFNMERKFSFFYILGLGFCVSVTFWWGICITTFSPTAAFPFASVWTQLLKTVTFL